MKSLVVIFAVLVVGIIFIVFWEFSSKPNLDQINYNEISWRLPIDQEIKKMGDTFFYSDIDLCSNYFIKKIEGEKYLIACDSGNGAWTYYTALASQKKVYLTPPEIILSIEPPQILVEKPAVDPLKQEPENSGKTTSPRKTSVAK